MWNKTNSCFDEINPVTKRVGNQLREKLQAEQDAMRMEFVLSQEKQEAERKIISAQGERCSNYYF